MRLSDRRKNKENRKVNFIRDFYRIKKKLPYVSSKADHLKWMLIFLVWWIVHARTKTSRTFSTSTSGWANKYSMNWRNKRIEIITIDVHSRCLDSYQILGQVTCPVTVKPLTSRKKEHPISYLHTIYIYDNTYNCKQILRESYSKTLKGICFKDLLKKVTISSVFG